MIASNFPLSISSNSVNSFTRYISNPLGPWAKLLLATTSAAGILGLVHYRWKNASQNVPQTTVKKDNVFESAKQRICKTYLYTFGGYLSTAAVAAACHAKGISLKLLNSNSYLVPFALTATMITSSIVASRVVPDDYDKIKHVAFAIFNATMGVMLSPLGYIDRTILGQAAAITLGIGSLITLSAFLAPDKKFLQWEGPLIAALATISIACTASYFIPSVAFAYGVDRISTYGGFAIYSFLLFISTNRLYDEANDKTKSFHPISAALDIYMDTLNLFLRTLRILLENKAKN